MYYNKELHMHILYPYAFVCQWLYTMHTQSRALFFLISSICYRFALCPNWNEIEIASCMSLSCGTHTQYKFACTCSCFFHYFICIFSCLQYHVAFLSFFLCVSFVLIFCHGFLKFDYIAVSHFSFRVPRDVYAETPYWHIFEIYCKFFTFVPTFQ